MSEIIFAPDIVIFYRDSYLKSIKDKALISDYLPEINDRLEILMNVNGIGFRMLAEKHPDGAYKLNEPIVKSVTDAKYGHKLSPKENLEATANRFLRAIKKNKNG